MRASNGSHSRSSCKRTRIATGACLRDEYSKQNRRAHGMSRDAKRGNRTMTRHALELHRGSFDRK